MSIKLNPGVAPAASTPAARSAVAVSPSTVPVKNAKPTPPTEKRDYSPSSNTRFPGEVSPAGSGFAEPQPMVVEVKMGSHDTTPFDGIEKVMPVADAGQQARASLSSHPENYPDGQSVDGTNGESTEYTVEPVAAAGQQSDAGAGNAGPSDVAVKA